jgi:hypothetical protein
MEPAGGNAALQSPTGTQVVLPSASRVAPSQADAGRIARHPHPLASASKPGAHARVPVGTQVLEPIDGREPAAHGAAGSAKLAPASVPAGEDGTPPSELHAANAPVARSTTPTIHPEAIEARTHAG